jgi:hypothetical protein
MMILVVEDWVRNVTFTTGRRKSSWTCTGWAFHLGSQWPRASTGRLTRILGNDVYLTTDLGSGSATRAGAKTCSYLAFA